MQIRLLGLAAALTAVVATAGCGLAGEESTEPSQRAGRITIGDRSQDTQSVKCTQDQWALSIEATADPGRARAFLELGGQQPTVRTVNFENIDGLNGVLATDAANAEATTSTSSMYTITGTAAVSDMAKPGRTTNVPFKFEAPC